MVYCNNCGQKNLDSANFCNKCGAKLVKVDEAISEDKTPIPQEEVIPAQEEIKPDGMEATSVKEETVLINEEPVPQEEAIPAKEETKPVGGVSFFGDNNIKVEDKSDQNASSEKTVNVMKLYRTKSTDDWPRYAPCLVISLIILAIYLYAVFGYEYTIESRGAMSVPYGESTLFNLIQDGVTGFLGNNAVLWIVMIVGILCAVIGLIYDDAMFIGICLFVLEYMGIAAMGILPIYGSVGASITIDGVAGFCFFGAMFALMILEAFVGYTILKNSK